MNRFESFLDTEKLRKKKKIRPHEINCVFGVSRPTVMFQPNVSFFFFFLFIIFLYFYFWQPSSPRGELSAKRAVKNVIDFCQADQNISSKSLASYFQNKKRKSEVVKSDRWKKKKKKKPSSIDLRKAFTPAHVDRSPISSASVAAGLFPNLSCLVSINL